MQKSLRLLTLTSGIAIIVISLIHISLGQSWLPDTQSVTASIDSQHRFYTALFLPYGAALVWVSRDVPNRVWALNVVLGALALGGVARIASLVAAGWPHPFFVGLGVAELLIPPVVYASAASISGKAVFEDVNA